MDVDEVRLEIYQGLRINYGILVETAIFRLMNDWAKSRR
jgi:hypothetical protein